MAENKSEYRKGEFNLPDSRLNNEEELQLLIVAKVVYPNFHFWRNILYFFLSLSS